VLSAPNQRFFGCIRSPRNMPSLLVSVGPPSIDVWYDFIVITVAYIAFGVALGLATYALKAPLAQHGTEGTRRAG
jgi:hypothetical protein